MKRKLLFFILVPLFLLVSVYFIYDTALSYSEISENDLKIKKIEARQQDIVRENYYIRKKIDRISKDSRAVEEILRLKYNMMRKDQFKYIPEK